jgi:hypothetical protein
VFEVELLEQNFSNIWKIDNRKWKLAPPHSSAGTIPIPATQREERIVEVMKNGGFLTYFVL